MYFKTLITFAILQLFTPCVSKTQVTLENIWQNYKYLPERVPGFNFMNDGRHYTRLIDNKILKYDILSGEQVEVILDGSSIDKQNGFPGYIESYTFSKDENYIILKNDSEKIYRRSSKAYFSIYDRDTQKTSPIRPGSKVSYATVSPDGNSVAYVFENNIYLQSLADGSTVAITNDGEYNHLINGSADWVYEEEFSFAKAFFWNTDGSKIAYLKFDESSVPEFTMTNYREGLYPEYQTFKYPKVGEKNAIVTAHIYNLSQKTTMDYSFDSNQDHYVPRLKWSKDTNTLIVYHLNRHQNHLRLFKANATDGSMTQLLEEKNKYYIDITDDIRFLKDGKHFIWSSEQSGFNHLYLYNMDGQLVHTLSSGEYDVTNFYGVDEKNQLAFYQAAEKNPMERQVFSVGLDGKSKHAVADNTGTNNVQFSPTFDYFINTHSGINTPPSYKLYDRKLNLLRTLEDNDALKEIMQSDKTQNVEFFSFNTPEDIELNGYMIKPPNMKAGQKYPVFMYVYGGPGSQNVTDSWKGQNYWWFQMLAQQGYVVACVDNRGTGARGEEFKKMTYLQLGKYETLDQTDAAKYLASLDFIDEKRIGIFGWSYGGYMSSLCILKSNDIFKMAIAVAPVTNWKWYDTVYTERYMRTVEENPEGYRLNSPVNFAERLKGKYLLIHGMGDDNVHFQHTAEMANALIKANKQFDTYFYPNRSHSISGGITRLHLYNKMTQFITENL